jgi:hypothetical protein
VAVDGACQGVFGVGLDRPGQAQHLVECDVAGGGGVGHPMFGQTLGFGLRLLGLFDHLLDAGQGGVIPDRVDAHPQARIGDHGGGHHPFALTARDRGGLAGDHRLVHIRGALDDLTVGRHPRTGTHQHDVAHLEVGDLDRLGVAVAGEAFGLVGHHLGQRRERPTGRRRRR